MTQMTARQKGDGQSMSEFDLIKRLFAPMADPVSSGDLQDDAACYSPPAKHDLIISTDALVSGVHFPENAPPEMVAARLVGANVSDLAAKGARPVGCVLTLCVGPHWDSAYLEAFAQALKTQLETYAMPLWGGDTVSGPTALVSLSVHGVVPHGEMLTRKGAGPAEDVYVTGTIGDGFLGLKEVQSGVPAAGNVASSAYCAYASPTPPLEFGQKLRQLATACMDVSDGLAADLDHLCAASGVAMDITLADIPLSEAGAAYLSGGGEWQDLLSGGDDYQLIFCAAASMRDDLVALAQACQLQLTRIGVSKTVQSNDFKANFVDPRGKSLVIDLRGYRHF